MTKDETPEPETRLTVEDGFLEGYLHGMLAGYYGHEDDGAPAPACEDCSCSIEDSMGREPDLETVSAPAALDFQKEVRDYLLRYDLIDEDDLVSQVVVCPEEVRALVERA